MAISSREMCLGVNIFSPLPLSFPLLEEPPTHSQASPNKAHTMVNRIKTKDDLGTLEDALMFRIRPLSSIMHFSQLLGKMKSYSAVISLYKQMGKHSD